MQSQPVACHIVAVAELAEKQWSTEKDIKCHKKLFSINKFQECKAILQFLTLLLQLCWRRTVA